MKNKTSYIVGNGLLVAIEVVLAIISSYITIGTVNLNLALIPIAMGAILYGVRTGALLGLVNGIIMILTPSTQALFFSSAPVGTIIVCLTKTTVAGIVAALIYKLARGKTKTGRKIGLSLISSLAVPIVNTALFVVGAIIFFVPALTKAQVIQEGQNAIAGIFAMVLTANFLVEILITLVVSPAIMPLEIAFNKHK